MFYKYKVGWYDSYNDKETYEEGIVAASEWSQAADRVVKSYGHDNVFDLYLKEIMCNDEEDYCLSKEEVDCAFKED